MDMIHSVLLGIVEGITEFLPISSTAHLIIASKFLGIKQTEFVQMFEVVIQSGAILAVILLQGAYVLKHRNSILTILFSFIPTAIIGFALHSIIKNVFFNSENLIIASMILIAVVFLIVEKYVKDKKLILNKTLESITMKHAVIIGFAQSLAVVPGVSRAGIVMIIMMVMGYKRSHAASYSFLLAVPTILAASALDLYKGREILAASTDQVLSLFIGWIISFITAFFAIKWLVGYLQKNTLVPFAIYRIALAIILVLFMHS